MTASTDPHNRADPVAPAAENRSTTTLLTDLVNQVTELFRKEIQLFRAEIGEKVSDVGTAVGMIVAGLVLALVAANALVAALIAGLAEMGIGGGWAALIVGVALALIGYGLVNSGVKSMKASNLAPERSARSLQKDVTVAKESVR